MLAPLGEGAVFFDDHRHDTKIDLLQPLGRTIEILQLTVATRTVVEAVFPSLVKLLFGKGSALVARVTWLPTSFSLAAFPFALFFRRIDDIRRGRLRGSRGVLLGVGQLILSFRQFACERRQARFQFLNAPFQSLAVRARLFLRLRHDGETLTHTR